MPDTNLLSGLTSAAPSTSSPTPSPAATASGPTPLPSDPVFQIPPIKQTLEGDIAGFWATKEDAKLPEYQLAVKNKQLLVDNGLAIYPMKNGGQAVFNPNVIGVDQVVALDKHGKLDDFLKPLSSVLSNSSPAAPVASSVPAATAALPAPTPAAVSRPLAVADAREYAAPTTRASKRPTPGAGSLLQTLQVQPK